VPTFAEDLDYDLDHTFLGDVAGGNGGEFSEAGWTYRSAGSVTPAVATITILDRRDLADTLSEIRREFLLRESDVPSLARMDVLTAPTPSRFAPDGSEWRVEETSTPHEGAVLAEVALLQDH